MLLDDDPPPYFSLDKTQHLIREIAEADELTIFSGAGLSADQGRPTWSELIALLLRDVARQRFGLELTDVQRQFVEYVLRTHDLLSAASIIRQELRTDLVAHIHRHLYRSESANPGGIFAKAVAYSALVWRLKDGRSVLVTTNYDDALEQAFESPGNQKLLNESLSATAFTGAESGPDERTIPIYHLHGYIPEDAHPRGELLFSEADFARLGAPQSDWRAELVNERLSNSTCLFVGLSMQDPGLARYLLHSAAVPKDPNFSRYAAFSIQGEDWRSENYKLRNALMDAARTRLHHLDLSEIRTYYYGQIPQLVSEASICRLLGPDEYFPDANENRYELRARRWWLQMSDWPLNRHQRFDESQAYCTSRLVAACKVVNDITEHHQDREPEGERFKVELWVKNPDHPRSLDLWSTSEARLTSVDAVLSQRIRQGNPYISVQTYCYGAPQMQPSGHEDSRWRYFYGAPIFLTGEGWYQLPVGVVSLASTRTPDRSCLTKLQPADRGTIWEALLEAGLELLTPPA